MHEIFIDFLAKNKSLPLPGIGQIEMVTEPAKLDFINKTIYPPKESAGFVPAPADILSSAETQETNKTVFQNNFLPFLAYRLNISESEAHKAFEQYLSQIKSSLEHQQSFTLPGIGILQKENDGLKLNNNFSSDKYFEPLHVEQVIRENTSHTIRVGEDEKTSEQMQEFLNRTEKKENWWIAAIILAVLGIAAIAWYYLQPA